MDLSLTKIQGFRRPLSTCIKKNGDFFVLTSNKNVEVFHIKSYQKYFKFTLNEDYFHNITSLVADNDDQILLVDNKNGVVIKVNEKFEKVDSLQLPGTDISIIKFNNELDSYFFASNSSKKVYKIAKNLKEYEELLDISSINDISFISSVEYHQGQIYLLNSDCLLKLSLESFKKNKTYARYLSFGRNGNGNVRDASDINIINEKLYVNDNKNYLIQVFDLAVNFLYQIGSKGNNIGEFDLPISSFVFKDTLFINDKNNDRIISLDTHTKKCKEVLCDKFQDGYLRRPSGVATNDEGYIYVSDRSNAVIQIFDNNLNFLRLLKINDSNLQRPSSVCLIKYKDGYLIAILERVSEKQTNISLYELSKDGFVANIYENFNFDSTLNDSQDMITGENNSIYIADTLNRRIINIDIEGNVINEANMSEISTNKRILIKTICSREDGNIYTADFDEMIIYGFNKDLILVSKIDFSSYKKDFIVLRGIYVTIKQIFLLVRGENQVLIANFGGEIMGKLDLSKKSNANWNHPVKICKISKEAIIVADKENDRLVKFNHQNLKFISET